MIDMFDALYSDPDLIKYELNRIEREAKIIADTMYSDFPIIKSNFAKDFPTVEIIKPKVKKIIFNDPCTIVIWNDNTKTIVKCQKGDKFDEEKGLAIAMCKKLYGNTEFGKLLDKYVKENCNESKHRKTKKSSKKGI